MASDSILYFVVTILFLSVLTTAIFWWKKSTLKAVFDGIIFPTCVISFFYFLPDHGIIVTFFSVMGILVSFSIIFWLAHETLPWLQKRLQRELYENISS